MQHPKLEALIRRDNRYPYEAYDFVGAALTHTLLMLGRKPTSGVGPMSVASPTTVRVPVTTPTEQDMHVTGQQLLAGIRDLAMREFGLMARTVFRAWGVNQTDDFGEIVFNLIEAGLMDRTDRDDRRDFHAVYDLDEALTRDYRIDVPQD